MPKLSYYIGSNVVVAGGNSEADNVHRVTFYHPTKGWCLLDKYNIRHFAMAVLENQYLLLVGGYDSFENKYSSDVVQ